MSNKVFSMTSALVLSGGIAVADVPKVAVDIAPVHSLVSKVMNGLGSPTLIIPAEASPHEYQLRPSEAKALQEAKLVFWIGEDLTPWLEKGLSTLAKGAYVTTLLEVDGIELLDFREGALFDEHDHDDFESFEVVIGGSADPDALKSRIEAATRDHGILRVKGFVHVEGKPRRHVIQGVGARIDGYYDRPWADGEAKESRLVVIGLHGLDRAAVTRALAG